MRIEVNFVYVASFRLNTAKMWFLGRQATDLADRACRTTTTFEISCRCLTIHNTAVLYVRDFTILAMRENSIFALGPLRAAGAECRRDEVLGTRRMAKQLPATPISRFIFLLAAMETSALFSVGSDSTSRLSWTKGISRHWLSTLHGIQGHSLMRYR